MYTRTFDLLRYRQEIAVNDREIRGSYDKLNCFLEVPLIFDLITPVKESRIEILILKAILLCHDSIISETFAFINISSYGAREGTNSKTIRNIRFQLPDKNLDFIEKHRNGDLNLQLRIIGNVKLSSVNKILGESQQIWNEVISENIDLMTDIKIEQSLWGRKMLPEMNYNCFRMIEIPVTHKRLKEAYDGVFKEFDSANTYFVDQKWDDCVGACRKAMDKLTENLKNYKENNGSGSKNEWLKNISSHTFTWIDNVNKANQRITSKPHHAGNYEFSPQEAESIYLVTLGLMNFIGHLK